MAVVIRVVVVLNGKLYIEVVVQLQHLKHLLYVHSTSSSSHKITPVVRDAQDSTPQLEAKENFDFFF